MENINSIVVTGNVVRNPEDKDIVKVGETYKMTVTIAVNRSIKRNGEWESIPSFFDVVMWGRLAENIGKYIAKGKSLAVKGELIQDRWEKDGEKKSRIYINADRVQLLGSGNKEETTTTTESHTNQTNNEGFPEDPVF